MERARQQSTDAKIMHILLIVAIHHGRALRDDEICHWKSCVGMVET